MEQAPIRGDRSTDASGPSLREQLEGAGPAARALLPVRFFFAVTFIYAGFDKLLDPGFFDAANPAGIVGQLTAFAHASPLAPLIKLSEPFAIPIGLLIAIGEIAIGLGALTGLAFRLAAVGGFAISMLFWLTASWTTHPYYFGADLPYAVGWLALALGGTGGLLVPRFVEELGEDPMDDWDRARAGGVRGGMSPRGLVPEPEISSGRRLMLQAGVLGAASLVVASLAIPLRLVGGGKSGDGTTALASDDGTGGNTDTPTPTGPAATMAADASPEESPEATADDSTEAPAATPFKATGLTVASIAAVDAKGAIRIRIPADAPSSLPAGDPGLVVKLKDGKYACYDTVCTHEGCRVGWDAVDGVMLCPCHGAAFDPNDHGAVLGGPTNQPLIELPIVIDHTAGTITLKA